MITLYRAVPKKFYIEGKKYYSLPTKRIPSNIPYLIDNIWELLRSDDFPSRRFSAYASPTIELALENASAVGDNREDYIVNKVVFYGEDYKMSHIKSSDARFHNDCFMLKKLVLEHLGKDFSNLSLEDKVKHAALFIPAIEKEELSNYFLSNKNNEKLLLLIKEASTFWNDASTEISDHNGELFFEVKNDTYYELLPV